MSSKVASRLIARIESIPTLPTVALRVIEVTADSKSSANDLMNIISPDVSLTTKILKIANSPFYGLTKEISSLQHAVTVLGFSEVRNLVISTVAFESFKNLKQDGQFNIKQFWRHSFTCGIAAKILATDLKYAGNELFVAGLVHDIGKLAIYMALPFEFLNLMEMMSSLRFKYMAFTAEKNTLGMTHDEVGMRLLKKWMFPEGLLTAVGFHHRPKDADTTSLFPIIVHIADILAHVYEIQAKDEKDNEDDIPEEKLYYNDIINISRPFGIGWNVSDIIRFNLALVESMKKEEKTMGLFF